MPTTVTKRLEIDAGHRLMKHEGKCANYHGHRFAFEITCTADELDDVGRIVDFSIIKRRVGQWLDEQFDHGMILEMGDPLIPFLQEQRHKLFILQPGTAPTSENLARVVFDVAQHALHDTGAKVVHVSCYETPTSRAGYSEVRK
jgi:6-pyruvoyltetrahydropterin/6-carboxytetrahydropterin synthase